MKDPRYPYALDLGSEVGGYRIEAVLGAGGFGITYRAVNDVTGKTVAIKEFYVRDISTRTGSTVIVDTALEAATYEFALGKFMAEAHSVVSRFDHPNIIKGENFLRGNNTCYLIMDYVDGLSLEDWLQARRDPPSERELRHIFEQVFDAVDYVHANNTMHRDLTPRNIMLRSDGTPILIDFGAAGQGIDLGRSSKMVAQMRYAPPEQTDENGPGVHGRYTDIFSLGGVLYRAISGKAPLAPTTRIVRMGRKDGGGADPQPPAAAAALRPDLYSPRFLSGIDEALKLHEAERPQSIAAFRAALGWVGTFDRAADPPPAGVRRPRPDITALAASATTTRTAAAANLPETVVLARDDEPAADGGLEDEAAGRARVAALLGGGGPGRRRALALGGGLGVLVAVVAFVLLSPDGLSLLLPPTVAPYRLDVDVGPDRLALAGYAPDLSTRRHLVAVAAAVADGRQVDNRIGLGAGAPENFTAIADGAIRLSVRLADGVVRLTDRTIDLDGTMRALEDAQAVEGDRAALPVGVTLDSVVLKPRRGVATQDCDRRAAQPDHVDRPADVPGVAADRLDAVAALVACAAARAEYPNVRRFATWLGRVHERAGHMDAARDAFELAAATGDAEALTALGRFAEDGIGAAADPARAYETYVRAVGLGSVSAKRRLGAMFLAGIGRAPDPARAADWFRSAAEDGDPEAMNQLGFMLQAGVGVGRDPAAALAEFGRAAALGSAPGAWNAAVLIDSGRVPGADIDRAADLVVSALRLRQPGAIEALTGDMVGFSAPMRVAVKKRLRDEAGYAGALDADWSPEARGAALKLLR
jgi:TPR repeat protein